MFVLRTHHILKGDYNVTTSLYSSNHNLSGNLLAPLPLGVDHKLKSTICLKNTFPRLHGHLSLSDLYQSFLPLCMVDQQRLPILMLECESVTLRSLLKLRLMAPTPVSDSVILGGTKNLHFQQVDSEHQNFQFQDHIENHWCHLLPLDKHLHGQN